MKTLDITCIDEWSQRNASYKGPRFNLHTAVPMIVSLLCERYNVQSSYNRNILSLDTSSYRVVYTAVRTSYGFRWACKLT